MSLVPSTTITSPMPGHRASALQNIFNEALTHTLKTITYENFAACFPTPATSAPDSLRAVWQQMSKRFEELARSEFDDILRERDVVRLLNELDTLVTRAWREKEGVAGKGRGEAVERDEGRPPAPHTLAPSAILAAHLAPSLGRQQSELESRMQQTQAQNVALTETIAAQQQELQRLVGELEGVIEDLDGAGQELDVVLHTEELAREVDGMDEELTQTRSG